MDLVRTLRRRRLVRALLDRPGRADPVRPHVIMAAFAGLAVSLTGPLVLGATRGQDWSLGSALLALAVWVCGVALLARMIVPPTRGVKHLLQRQSVPLRQAGLTRAEERRLNRNSLLRASVVTGAVVLPVGALGALGCLLLHLAPASGSAGAQTARAVLAGAGAITLVTIGSYRTAVATTPRRGPLGQEAGLRR